MRSRRLGGTTMVMAAVAVIAGPVAPAGADETASPTPGAPVVVVAAAGDPASAATFPVEDFTAPAGESYAFSRSSADGAVTDTGDREFRLSSDVLFAFDKATPNARARREIARIAGILKARPGVTRVAVTGYTDKRGSDSYNLGLSRRRAAAVRTGLAEVLGGGVTITATGRGETDPIADNSTAAGRKLNRRVEIRLS